MASLLQVSAALARHATARARASPSPIGVLSAVFAIAPSPFQNSDGQRASITSTRMLAKRRGGNSAFVAKAPKFRGPRGPFKKKEKLKAETAPHKTHLDRIRELKAHGKENERNATHWEQLESDAELNTELDNVYEYLKNLGPDGEYIYRPDPTLADLDETQVLAKLNALARGDAGVLAEIQEKLQDTTDAVADQLQELSVDDYNFLMRVYAEKGLHEKANALLARMEKNLPSYIAPILEPTPVLASTTTDAIATTDEESLDAVSHAIAPDTKTYMYYVVSLVQAGAMGPAAAVRTLGRMKERGLEPTIHVYNSVMNVCAKAGKVQWAYNIFEKMQLAGLTPDRASFTILMHAAIAQGELDKAFETFHLMRAHVTDPDVVAFTVLIQGYAKIGRIERAINLYEDLLECGLTPSHITFNALILACAKSHYYAHKAVEFYHEMQELYDYHPDLFTYNNVLHACAKHGDYIQAERVWRQMLKHQVPLEAHAFNTLLNVYARAQIKKIVAQASRNKAPLPPPEEIYQEPMEFDDDGREIDLTRPFKETSSMENWNYDGTFDEEDDDEDEDEYDEYDDDDSMEAARDQGLSPEEQAALDAIRAHDNKQRALMPNMEPLTDDELDNTPMDLRNYGKFQTQVILRAERIYTEMTQDCQLTPTVVTLTTMLAVYANALRLGRSEHFFEAEFAKHDVQPNEHTYRTMMQMYVRAHRTPKAEALLAEIKHKINDGELKPDGITLGMLVDHYTRHKKLRKALTLLEEADEMNVQLVERHYKKIRRVTEKLGLFTELIPEDPDAVITAGTRGKLKEKRKVRAQVIAFNQKVGKKFLLPASVTE